MAATNANCRNTAAHNESVNRLSPGSPPFQKETMLNASNALAAAAHKDPYNVNRTDGAAQTAVVAAWSAPFRSALKRANRNPAAALVKKTVRTYTADTIRRARTDSDCGAGLGRAYHAINAAAIRPAMTGFLIDEH